MWRQQVLPFDFWEKEKEMKEAQFKNMVDSLPYFPEPQNDNEKLFNLQKEYYKGDQNALKEMFLIAMKISAKIMYTEMKNHRLYFDKEIRNEKVMDSVILFIEQIKKNNLVIKTSFVAYLRLQVIKILFMQTKAQKFEKWCIQKGINIFEKDETEKVMIKNCYIEETNKGGKVNFDGPEEQRTFTTEQIAELLHISLTFVLKAARRNNLQIKTRQDSSHAYYWTYLDYKVIEKAVQTNKKINAMRKPKNVLNTSAINHPLVTDKRCLNLYYWPDIIPDCFKEMED